MPELPEVHITATMLHRLVTGIHISAVWTDYGSPHHTQKDNIKNPKFFRSLKRKILGSRFTKVSRRGKNVLLELDNGETILVHMKMTGHILYGNYLYDKKKDTWTAAEEKSPLSDFRNQFIHFVITLSDGKHLVLSDMRKFAKVTIIPTKNLETSDHLASIGPEPLETSFDFPEFKNRLLTKPRGAIKQVLMNPEVVAGIGNIYSDEILFASGIHPLSTTSKIPEQKLERMFRATKEILRKGIDFGGDSTSDYRNPLGVHGKFQYHHQAYRNTGKPCGQKGCPGTIRKLKLGGRSAHFCDIHQCKYN